MSNQPPVVPGAETGQDRRHLFKSAGVIGGLTSLSRVLGFVRDMVIAAAFGTGTSAEAFVVSFRIPNLLRDLVGEGATNSAFVPVLTECHEKNRQAFWGLVNALFWVLSAVLVAVSLAGMLFAGEIVGALAPGFVRSADPTKYHLTVQLTRVIFPYIFLIGLSALAMGILNSMREFASSAFGPVLLNISMIISGVFFERFYGPMALVAGVLVGGVLQLLWQVGPLVRCGFRFRRPSFGHGYVGRIGRLLVPRALGSAVYQINVLVDSVLASFERIVGAGGQSALYYSNRLFQLPLAVFGLALAQAVLPTFSSQRVRGQMQEFKQTLTATVQSLFFLALPSATGLVVLSQPIIRILFEKGRFDAYSTQITSGALTYHAFGLLSCCLVKIFVNAFYAMQDTRTPVKSMALSVAFNIALSLVLMYPMKIAGLALASSVSATLNVLLLYFLLRKRIGAVDERRILAGLIRVLAASVVMGTAAWGYRHAVLEPSVSAPKLHQALLLGSGIAVSICVYFFTAWLLKVEEARRILPLK